MADENQPLHGLAAADFVSQEHILELKEELLAAIHQQESDYSWIFAILLFGIIVGIFTGLKKVLIDFLTKLAKKSDTKIDDAIFEVVNQWTQPYVVISFAAFAATYVYPVAESIDLIAKLAFLGIVTWRVLRSIEYSVLFVSDQWFFDNSLAGENLEANFRKAVRIFLYAAGFIFVADNIGLNLSSIVAGLGIGGLAIALACQATLGDAIASVTLFVDQPFKIGDYVTINGQSGIIDQIGFKTTKLRSNQGELIVFPNSVVSASTIHNFARAPDGRLNQNTTVSVHLSTDTEVVQKIPHYLFEALSGLDELTPTEIYLVGFGEYSIDYDVRYSVAHASPVTCRAALGKVNQIVVQTFRNHHISPPIRNTRVEVHNQ